MPTIASKGPQIAIRALKGINLRVAKSQLNPGESDRLQGCWPQTTGAKSRIPGKVLWHVFESGTTPEAVYQVAQAFMGQQANMIVQHGDSISLDSLDYYLNRVSSYTLTPTSTAATAILGNVKASGTDGGALGATDNTFYPSTLAILSDSNSVVLSCINNVFQLPQGTYQIKALVSFYCNSASVASYCRAGLYNVSNGRFQTQLGGSVEIISTAGRLAAGSSVANPINGRQNGVCYLYGRFQVTAVSETFSIQQAVAANTASQGLGSPAQGQSPSNITTEPDVYHLVKISRE